MNLTNILLVEASVDDDESVNKMIIVNTAAINFLEFNASIYDYLDALSDARVDPYEHLQNIEHQLLFDSSCH
jgi:hypothetical protein